MSWVLKDIIAQKRKELVDKKLCVSLNNFAFILGIILIQIDHLLLLQENGKTYFKRAKLLEQESNESSETQSGSTNTDTSRGSIDAENSMIDSAQTLSRVEVTRKLRERGQPILLFGESEIDSFKRLRRVEILEPEVNKVC